MLNSKTAYGKGWVFVCISLMFAVSISFIMSRNVDAVSAADWQAGRIIDDSLFYNGSTMSVDEIQQFLNTRVPSCDTWGTKPTASGQTRANYGRSVGVPPPYICLKDYYENPTTHATNFNSSASLPTGSISAAQIIWSAAYDYNISPKVLLATLQKEAAGNLIGDDWPFPSQYRSAMGYGCPDTAPCDAEYYGFYNQMYNAARQFRRYATYPNEYRYKAGVTNFIQFNPNASCSGTSVFIQNQATAGLYNYTPYQPNQPALNNLYGTGDGCSAYGNRNFWRIYNDWFGSTLGSLWRTTDNGTLYLVEGGRKYLIASIGMLEQFGLGSRDVRFVSQQQLDAVPEASGPFSSSLGQIVKSPSDSDADGGTIYLFDGGRKIPISSMEQFANFGFTMQDITYLPIELIQRYPSDAVLSSFIRDPNLSLYQMDNGKKRVFFELSKYNQVNPLGLFTNLTSFTLTRWQFGQPQIDGSYLVTGPDGTINLYNGTSYYALSSMATYDCWGLSKLRSYRLSSYEYVNGTRSGILSCVGKDSTGTMYIMDGNQKYVVTTPKSFSSPGDDVFTTIPTKPLPSTVQNNVGEISVIENEKRRPLASMLTYSALGLGSAPIRLMTNGAYYSFLGGGVKLASGNLILDETGTVSVINGDSSRYLIPSAKRFEDYGYDWGSLIRLPTSALLNYPAIGPLPGGVIRVSNEAYIIDSGTRYLIPNASYSTFGINLGSLSDVSLDLVSRASQQTASKFILDRSSGGTVYMLESGKRRPITSWAALLREGNGSPAIIRLSTQVITSFPVGPPIF